MRKGQAEALFTESTGVYDMIKILLALTLTLASTFLAAGEIRLVWSSTTGAGTIGGDNISATTGDIVSLDVIFDNTLSSGWAAVSLDFLSAPLSLLSITPSTTLAPEFTSASVEANAGAPVLADGTGDGVVGLADLIGLGDNLFTPNPAYDFGSAAGPGLPDAIVNFFDAAILNSNYGAGSPVASSSTNALYISIGHDLFSSAPLAASQLLATLNFQVTGAIGGNINPFFNAGVDGIFDSNRQDMTTATTLSGATLNGGVPSVDVPAPTTFLLFCLGLVGLSLSRRKRALSASY